MCVALNRSRVPSGLAARKNLLPTGMHGPNNTLYSLRIQSAQVGLMNIILHQCL